MAKLGSYYGLCPLIDQKSLLGVSEDVTPGCVIVTLGKNMAIKYKLSDQKQIHSWSTKEKLSSPVIYDKKANRYVAVFNLFSMRLWNENEKNLDKIKKIKFPIAIHTLISSEDGPVVIFKNGLILTLEYALEKRKELKEIEIFDKTSEIEDQTLLKINDVYYMGLFVKVKKDYLFLWLPVKSKTNEDLNDYRKIELSRAGVKLNGHVVMITDTGPVLFTLWSDGRLYNQSLSSISTENFYSVIESLSRKQQICLLALNSTYLAMYGADINQEGASLQIYNIQFKVTQSKMQLKLFTTGSKLWLIENSILLTIGQNLAVVPVHLATEQLAALVGSHKLINSSEDEDVAIVTELIEENWVENEKNSEVVNENIFKISPIEDLMKEGWSEAAICEEIFPKLFKKQDMDLILSILDNFSDIPESTLVKLISFCLQKLIKLAPNNFDGQYKFLLDKILTISYSEVLLVPQLRAILTFDEILILLQYFCHLLSENGNNLPNCDSIKSEEKIIDWGCLLLDAHYQQLLLSKDEKVIEHLKYFKALMDTYVLCIDECKKIEPILNQIRKEKKSIKLINASSLKYSIEKLKLY